jgi:Arc/MetJ family transcription regulator
MYYLMHTNTTGGMHMRTTLTIDDQLLADAQQITGMTEKTALVREGLRALIERESARRLALLGGSETQLQAVSRRQSDPA